MRKPGYTLTSLFNPARLVLFLQFPLNLLAISSAVSADAPAGLIEFSESERASIASFGPWPSARLPDKSNRVDGNKQAIRLGEILFFDRNLSESQTISCASCHIPERHFTDGRVLGFGNDELHRNTPTVVDLGGNRWFGWGGESDSLWAQSIRPIIAAREMASSARFVQRYLQAEPEIRTLYQSVFGAPPSDHSEQESLVNTGKALAAYQATLHSGRSPFDDFRDAIVEGNDSAASHYPVTAQRGLKVFIGKGRCNLCHFGPKLNNGEFADIGIPFFTDDGVDSGRYTAIKLLKKNPFSLLGSYNDDDSKSNAVGTEHISLQHRNWGEFKVPSLRNVAKTAPYMHNGSLPTLPDVVTHYSELDEERLHTDGEKILRPLNLSEQEVNDLIAFLESLSDK